MRLDDATTTQDSKDRRMRNLKVTVSYDGADFSGWQVQPDATTVQGTLTSAIGRITGEKVLPQGSGRTDAGVHALAQVMTFVTESVVPTGNFVKALNDILPASVRVSEVEEAAPEFHARHSAGSIAPMRPSSPGISERRPPERYRGSSVSRPASRRPSRSSIATT